MEGKFCIGFAQLFLRSSSPFLRKLTVPASFQRHLPDITLVFLNKLPGPHYRTVSPRLEDNCVSKCSYDSFHTKNIIMCGKLSEPHFYVFCSSILGRRFEKQGKLWEKFVQQFSPFHGILPAIRDQQCIVM